MRLSLLEILEATGGGEVGGTQVGETFSTFHTDSREVKQGGVFFALRGQEMDGTEFVADAIARGAAAVVVQRKTEIPSGIVEILVPDTWKALYALASHALRRVQPLVVAVTGSNGKTSTKDRKSTRLNSSHSQISYAVFCLKKKKNMIYASSSASRILQPQPGSLSPLP